MSGVTGDRLAPEGKVSNTGRAVLLLALFVVLFIALLHELDNSPSLSTTKAHTSKPAQQAVAPVTTTTQPARSPDQVKVLVANGVGVSGAASKVAGRLQPIGYILAKPGDTTNKQVTSAVEFAPGYQAEAQALASSLGMAASAVQPIPNPIPVPDMQGANVVVVVGNDLASAAGATSTTEAGSAAGSSSVNGPLTTSSTTSPTSNTSTTLAGQ